MLDLINNLDRKEISKMLLGYKFALEEVNMKISILLEEFRIIHEYNPIEHVSTRIKSPKSIMRKIEHKKLAWSLHEIEDKIRDIAGVRIVCSFEEDIYRVAQMLCNQNNLTVVEVKDYIKKPKENGYRSLHLIVKIPIFLTDSVRDVFVEIQIRTIAMDFWASLEHKIFYKYNKAVPTDIKKGLKEAADQVTALDNKMASLNKEVSILKAHDIEGTSQTDDMGKYIQQFIEYNSK
ncbi:MAG: GTP pyrophosphokinase family protein [Lysinibacillus sp.]